MQQHIISILNDGIIFILNLFTPLGKICVVYTHVHTYKRCFREYFSMPQRIKV